MTIQDLSAPTLALASQPASAPSAQPAGNSDSPRRSSGITWPTHFEEKQSFWSLGSKLDITAGKTHLGTIEGDLFSLTPKTTLKDDAGHVVATAQGRFLSLG